MRPRSAVVALLMLVAMLTLPGIAIAQSAIAGTVRDTSGAVLPGVTVEATSPALIEKVRTGTTNEAGQYRVVDLRPGVYTVSFKLPGFSTVVRENIELPLPQRVLHTRLDSPGRAESSPESVLELLRAVDLFSLLSPDELNQLRRDLVPRRFGKNERVIEEGEAGHTFYLLASG